MVPEDSKTSLLILEPGYSPAYLVYPGAKKRQLVLLSLPGENTLSGQLYPGIFPETKDLTSPVGDLQFTEYKLLFMVALTLFEKLCLGAKVTLAEGF